MTYMHGSVKGDGPELSHLGKRKNLGRKTDMELLLARIKEMIILERSSREPLTIQEVAQCNHIKSSGTWYRQVTLGC